MRFWAKNSCKCNRNSKYAGTLPPAAKVTSRNWQLQAVLSFLKNKSSKVEFSWHCGPKIGHSKLKRRHQGNTITPGRGTKSTEGLTLSPTMSTSSENELQPVPSMAEALASAKAREEALEKELKELQACAVQLAAVCNAVSQRK
jgi:hypothetical protein